MREEGHSIDLISSHRWSDVKLRLRFDSKFRTHVIKDD